MDNVDAVVGLHAFTDAPLGTIEVSSGPLMAAVDDFDLTILGKSAHGADPYKGVDAIVIAAQVLSAIQTIVSRRLPTKEAGVITVGTIHGGERRNVLAERVAMEGTIRTFVPAVRKIILTELKRACEISSAMSGSFELTVSPHAPAVNNDPDLTRLVQQVGSDILGGKKVHPAHPEMGGEDFAFLIKNTPGVYIRIGVATPGEPRRRTHTSTFDLDERALPIGAAILAETSRRWLTNTSAQKDQKE
jgi:amidohydrolase